MRHQILAVIAALAAAGCAPQQTPVTSEEYVPHGRAPAATPMDQALRECRLEVESAGRRSTVTTGPTPLRQIPEPPAARPVHASVQACMDAKGYRRAGPSS